MINQRLTIKTKKYTKSMEVGIGWMGEFLEVQTIQK